MSGRGLKRFIRPEEGDTPRTQDYFPSDEPPRSDETPVLDSFGSGAASFHHNPGPGYGRDLHGTESAGAALAPQQHAEDANAELMQQLRLDGDQRSRHIQGSVVTCDYSTRMQWEQVQQALHLFDACGADLSKLHFNVYARFDSTTPVGTFWQLAPYQYSHSKNKMQIFLRVPITVFYEDGREDEVVQFGCKLYTEKHAGADGCKKLVLHFMNVPYDQLDLLNAATRRVVRRMKMRLPAGQRLQYELPKFQGCHSYSLPTKLTRDDLDDLRCACAASEALKNLTVKEGMETAPQLLNLEMPDQSWKVQVCKNKVTFFEWFDMSTAAPCAIRHSAAKDALVQFSAQRSNTKRRNLSVSDTASRGGGGGGVAAAAAAAAFHAPGPSCVQDVARFAPPCVAPMPLAPPLLDMQDDVDDDSDDDHFGEDESEPDLGEVRPLLEDDNDDVNGGLVRTSYMQDHRFGWSPRGA